MKNKILGIVVYTLAAAATLIGIAAIETCWEYWHVQMEFTTAAAIGLLAAVILFSAGLISLTWIYYSVKNHNSNL